MLTQEIGSGPQLPKEGVEELPHLGEVEGLDGC